jgi:hypothetical protein
MAWYAYINKKLAHISCAIIFSQKLFEDKLFEPGEHMFIEISFKKWLFKYNLY